MLTTDLRATRSYISMRQSRAQGIPIIPFFWKHPRSHQVLLFRHHALSHPGRRLVLCMRPPLLAPESKPEQAPGRCVTGQFETVVQEEANCVAGLYLRYARGDPGQPRGCSIGLFALILAAVCHLTFHLVKLRSLASRCSWNVLPVDNIYVVHHDASAWPLRAFRVPYLQDFMGPQWTRARHPSPC
jgi:hypothetical protein